MEKGMTPKEINVIKRDGTKTPLDLDKVHRMVELACEGLAGVSESHVEVNSGLQFFDGIKTSDIQEVIRSANDLISLEAPNYQYVAADCCLVFVSLCMVSIQTNILILEHMPIVVLRKESNIGIANQYTLEKWDKLNSYIDHDRDYLFTYAGIRQVGINIMQDRSTGEITRLTVHVYDGGSNSLSRR